MSVPLLQRTQRKRKKTAGDSVERPLGNEITAVVIQESGTIGGKKTNSRKGKRKAKTTTIGKNVCSSTSTRKGNDVDSSGDLATPQPFQKIQQLREERMKRNKELIDNSNAEDLRTLVSKLCKICPGLISELLNKDEDPPCSPHHIKDFPDYCICGRCVEMTGPYADFENTCCEEQPSTCHSVNLVMDTILLHGAVLALDKLTRQDSRSLDTLSEEEIQRASRHQAYMQYKYWQYGRRSWYHGHAIPIPSCVVKKIRAKFPSPNEVYKGFDPDYEF